MGKTHLDNARKNVNDDFYTQYADVKAALKRYDLRGLRVYCPCDDYRMSNFVRYLQLNFAELGLAHLTATCFDIGAGAWRYDYDGQDRTIAPLTGNGDFASEECLSIMRQNDVVITNPPFSLIRAFIDTLITEGRRFLIIGPATIIGCKGPFAHIRADEMWVDSACDTSMTFKKRNGRKASFHNIVWLTNMPIDPPPPLRCSVQYSPNLHPKYDDYDAIECANIHWLPKDYPGVIGIPITALPKVHRGGQFNVIQRVKPHINGKNIYDRILIQKI